MRYVHICSVEGKQAICFETGLDPLSFARAKMSQSLVETGHIVFPDGSCKTWKPSSVNEADGFMRIWGPLFAGERLDLLINEINPQGQDASPQAQDASPQAQAALQAVVFWIRAKLLLGDTPSAINPGAAFISRTDSNDPEYPPDCVFFAPDNLSQRCLLVEGAEPNYYSCPDLKDMEAAAFCAGAMLYRILTQSHPYPVVESVFQDMREGVFVPLNFAAPGLDEKICGLIQAALFLPVEKKRTIGSGTGILGDLLNMLMDKEGGIMPASSLFHALTVEENALLETEKEKYLKKNNIIVKVSRFVTRNKAVLTVAAAVFIFAVFIMAGMIKNRSELPTTAGLDSNAVVAAYYEAFGLLDHVFLEACLMGANKNDVDVVINMYVIDKVRQAYELKPETTIIPAEIWKQQGGALPAPDVFGVTDLHVRRLGGSEEESRIRYSADYLLWVPDEPEATRRSDEITLMRDKRKNWRIVEINRIEH